jgi:uncharacterized coiled-coil protein SlyX
MNQFMHLDAYGSKNRKNSGKKRGYAAIIAEAERRPGFCPHVSEPKPPILLHGCLPSELLAELDANNARVVDARGRSRAGRAPLLLTAVLSWPGRERVDAWERDSIAWLAGMWGDNLRSVVAHIDEDHHHIHAYAVVPLDAQGRARIEDLHPGFRAVRLAIQSGLPKGAQGVVYKGAMRRLQDDYHLAVGARHGLSRVGPRRRRLTREEYRAEQESLRLQAAREQALRQREEEIERVGGIDGLLRRLAVAEATIEALKKKLAEVEEALAKRVRQVGRLLQRIFLLKRERRARQQAPAARPAVREIQRPTYRTNQRVG